MNANTVDLTKPLPYPSRWRWGYQHYPVYSGAWWRGRTLVFALGVLLMALMTGLGMIITFEDKTAALMTALVTLVGIGGMAFSGATFCTLARYFIGPGIVQQCCVTLGLIAGCLAALMFDAWSSAYIENAFLTHSPQAESIEALADAERRSNTAMVLDAAFSCLLYFWLASGIAYIRYWREPGQLNAYLAQQELTRIKASKVDVQSRLSMLQAQIEPHFLFNSLASIKSTVRDSPAVAENSIDDLVDYLRASIPRLDEQQQAKPSSIAQQVDLCEKYLKVMQLRMGDRLRYASEVDARVGDKAFPPLLIISLVENAIKHGLEPKAEGGSITISALAEGSTLLITIEDTGIGLNDTQSSALSSGLGLANVREQLAVLFGDDASLHLQSNQFGGATALVRVDGFMANDDRD